MCWSYSGLLTVHRCTPFLNLLKLVPFFKCIKSKWYCQCTLGHMTVSHLVEIIPLNKTESSFPRSYQMPVTPQSEVRYHAHLFSPCLEMFAWACAFLVYHVLPVVPSCVGKNAFRFVIYHFGVWQSFCLSWDNP